MFRARGPAGVRPPPLSGLVALLLIVGAAAFLRPRWVPRLPEGALVEVRGEVPHPGTYLVERPTVARAIEAAGGTYTGEGAEREVPAGYQVVLREGRAAIRPPPDPLLVGLPVDVNTAGVEAIAAIPGLSRSTARAIVEDRARRGPFYTLDEVRRVRGVGPTTLDRLRPFATVGDPGERPPPARLDLNRATAEELERLPGIGPVTAARIVVDREDRGPFRSVEELQRVKGIGPKTVAGLADRVEVR